MRDDARLDELKRYYDLRAPEYEAMYYRPDPARRAELDAVAARMRTEFSGRNVLEIACGTGYWTEVLAGTAKRVVAVDISEAMLELAQQKGLSPGIVEFARADCYDLAAIPGTFDGGVANFWISHVPKARMSAFLDGFHAKLAPGARVLMADNFFKPGQGGEFVQSEDSEDSFRLRSLRDGSTHRILKNYYDVAALERIFAPYVGDAGDIEIDASEHYWCVRYTARRSG